VVQLRSNIRFDRRQLELAVGSVVHEVTTELAQIILDDYAAAAPRSGGAGPHFADGLTAELRGKTGYRTDLVLHSDVPHGFWVERRWHPLGAFVARYLREFLQDAARRVDFDAVAARTGQSVGRVRRTFHARAAYTGRVRGRRPVRSGRRRRNPPSGFRRTLNPS